MGITLTEPVPKAFEIPPADWPEKYFSGQSVGRSRKTTLSPSYTKWFFSSIEVHVVAWPVKREDSRGEFRRGTLEGGGVLSTATTSKNFGNTVISHKKIAKYRNVSIGRVETGCHIATTTLHVKFRANNT